MWPLISTAVSSCPGQGLTEWIWSPSQGQAFRKVSGCTHWTSPPNPITFNEPVPGDRVGVADTGMPPLRRDKSKVQGSRMS